MKRLFVLAVVGCALAAHATPARAAPIVFTPPGAPFTASNIGQARSVIFEVTSATSITSFGIQMDPLVAAFSLRADLYTVNPTTFARNPLVASSAVQPFTDMGLAFYDVPFAQSFVPGTTYELELQPPGPGGFGFGQFNMTFFNFNGFPPAAPPNPPFLAGPYRILDGAGTGVGGPSNTVIALFRVDDVGTASAVPEPATLAVFGVMAASAFGLRRRMKGVPVA